MMDGEKLIFTVPLVTITNASDKVENNSGGMGRKVMFGTLSNRSEGFVFVTAETADAARESFSKSIRRHRPESSPRFEFARSRPRELYKF